MYGVQAHRRVRDRVCTTFYLRYAYQIVLGSKRTLKMNMMKKRSVCVLLYSLIVCVHFLFKLHVRVQNVVCSCTHTFTTLRLHSQVNAVFTFCFCTFSLFFFALFTVVFYGGRLFFIKSKNHIKTYEHLRSSIIQVQSSEQFKYKVFKSN